MKRLNRTAALTAIWLAIFGAPKPADADDGFDYYQILSMNGDKIKILHYHAEMKEVSSIKLSNNIKISDNVSDLFPKIHDVTVNKPGDLDDFILKNGLGEVIGNDPPSHLTSLQAVAKSKRIGMWSTLPADNVQPAQPPVSAPSAPQPTAGGSQAASSEAPPDDGPTIFAEIGSMLTDAVKFTYSFWKEMAAAGLVGGVLSFIIRWVRRRFWIERHVTMSVIGLKGSGKSSVLGRFSHSHMTEEKVRGASPTIATEIFKRRNPIPMGRYEVFPTLHDNPGENWGAFFQSLATKSGYKRHIALLVLAPTDEIDATASNWRKDQYIQEQIGLAKGLIGGCLGAEGIRKPELIIIYLNKFDLISRQSPDDSSSREKVSEFKNVFGSFLRQKIITSHERTSPTPIVRIVVGSALKDWGNKAILSAIEDALYMGARS